MNDLWNRDPTQHLRGRCEDCGTHVNVSCFAQLVTTPWTYCIFDGVCGLVNAHLQWLQNYCLARSDDGGVEEKIIFWCYNNVVRVPEIKVRI